VQLLGLVSIGAFAFVTSWLTWLALEKTMGVRVSPQVERLGQDVAELGIDAYPEFVLMPEQDEEI
jgi:Amt family ammonium transporter